MTRIIFALVLLSMTFVANAQLYERSGRNMGLQIGYDFTSLSHSKKGFLPGEYGSAFRIGYTRSFGDFIYPGIIFNYRINHTLMDTDTNQMDLNFEFKEIKTPSLQIPILIQIPFVPIPLGKSKKRECSYLNTNFRIGPEFSYNFKSKSDIGFISNNEWALQTAFGFNVSKSGGTHRRMAWDVQWHIVWRKAFNQMGSVNDQKFYNNYLGLTLTVIRYATSSFL